LVIRYKIVFKLEDGKEDTYLLDESRILDRAVEIKPIPQVQMDRMLALAYTMRDWLRDMGGASIEAKTLGKKA